MASNTESDVSEAEVSKTQGKASGSCSTPATPSVRTKKKKQGVDIFSEDKNSDDSVCEDCVKCTECGKTIKTKNTNLLSHLNKTPKQIC